MPRTSGSTGERRSSQSTSLRPIGSAPTLGIDNFDRKGPKGIEIGLIEAFHLGNFKGFKLDVKNAGDVPMDIQEKDFYRSGDLAFYVENRVLNPKTSTIMYVVTRG